MYCNTASVRIDFLCCTFLKCTTSGSGSGAIYLYASSSNLALNYSAFERCRASSTYGDSFYTYNAKVQLLCDSYLFINPSNGNGELFEIYLENCQNEFQNNSNCYSGPDYVGASGCYSSLTSLEIKFMNAQYITGYANLWLSGSSKCSIDK